MSSDEEITLNTVLTFMEGKFAGVGRRQMEVSEQLLGIHSLLEDLKEQIEDAEYYTEHFESAVKRKITAAQEIISKLEKQGLLKMKTDKGQQLINNEEQSDEVAPVEKSHRSLELQTQESCSLSQMEKIMLWIVILPKYAASYRHMGHPGDVKWLNKVTRPVFFRLLKLYPLPRAVERELMLLGFKGEQATQITHDIVQANPEAEISFLWFLIGKAFQSGPKSATRC